MSSRVIDKLAWVHVRNGSVLMTRTKGRERFFLPGGKRMPGETDAQALMREVREELGVALAEASITLLGAFDAPAEGQPAGTVVRMTCYTANPDREPAPAGEISELAWFTPADAGRGSAASQMMLHWLHARGLLTVV
jgi:8-oxo-dGTP pyrophosphatase MutT (NUDIX family)